MRSCTYFTGLLVIFCHFSGFTYFWRPFTFLNIYSGYRNPFKTIFHPVEAPRSGRFKFEASSRCVLGEGRSWHSFLLKNTVYPGPIPKFQIPTYPNVCPATRRTDGTPRYRPAGGSPLPGRHGTLQPTGSLSKRRLFL